MKRLMDSSEYGDAIAEVYDELLSPMAAVADAAVAFLAALAPGGTALELGVGTGRLALPLAAAGIRVHGIDASERMLHVMRSKVGGDAISTTLGDIGELVLPTTFDLVYIAFNTLFALLSQEKQLVCVGNAARMLRPGGTFVVEAFVPHPERYQRSVGQAAEPASDGYARLIVNRHDPSSQRIGARQILPSASGLKLLPVQLRYIWPAELDLMARAAGLKLQDRFGGWSREPFDHTSISHVSVYTGIDPN